MEPGRDVPWEMRDGALNQGFVQTWATLLAQDVARRQGRADLEAAFVEAYEEFGTRFAPGHQVRLEIASSNFPTYDRNLNTGGPIGTEPIAAAVMAGQTVFHDPARPSRLVPPTIAA